MGSEAIAMRQTRWGSLVHQNGKWRRRRCSNYCQNWYMREGLDNRQLGIVQPISKSPDNLGWEGSCEAAARHKRNWVQAPAAISCGPNESCCLLSAKPCVGGGTTIGVPLGHWQPL
jgi:hypothetical protein